MPRAKKPPTVPYNTGTPQPAAPEAPTGLPYGENQASIEAQTAQPMAGSGPGIPAESPQAALQQIVQGARDTAMPGGGAGLLTGPSQRPWEPSTTGMPLGPGPGPEVLGMPPRVSRRASDTIAELAEVVGSDALRALADRARSRGQ